MSTFMIGAVCYVAGMCFVLALLLYFASNKRKKEALDQEQHSLCIHCKKMVPTHTLNHWEECEVHPARIFIEDMKHDFEVLGDGLREVFHGLETSKAENDRLKAEFIHLLSVFMTVRRENQPEWMEAIVEDINRACVALGETDRFWTFGGHIVRINKPAIDLAKNGADTTVIAEVQL